MKQPVRIVFYLKDSFFDDCHSVVPFARLTVLWRSAVPACRFRAVRVKPPLFNQMFDQLIEQFFDQFFELRMGTIGLDAVAWVSQKQLHKRYYGWG